MLKSINIFSLPSPQQYPSNILSKYRVNPSNHPFALDSLPKCPFDFYNFINGHKNSVDKHPLPKIQVSAGEDESNRRSSIEGE